MTGEIRDFDQVSKQLDAKELQVVDKESSPKKKVKCPHCKMVNTSVRCVKCDEYFSLDHMPVTERGRSWSDVFYKGEIITVKGINMEIVKIKQLRGEIVLKAPDKLELLL